MLSSSSQIPQPRIEDTITRTPQNAPLTSHPPHTSTFAAARLTAGELVWKSRYSFLQQKGYLLRPRYKPDWTPSWKNGKDPWSCEDGIFQILPMVLDARRTSDNLHVCLKLIENAPQEVEIAQYLSSEKLRHHPHNHCAPIFDAFRDSTSPNIQFLVMPIFRPFDDPDFGTVPEIIDFVTQVLEGLLFMHENHVAHCDATGANIMMDAKPILPDGWHFVAYYAGLDGFQSLQPLSRVDYPVRYFYIDFGYSHHYQPGESRFIEHKGGRDGDVPELYTKGPRDLFKIDVYTIGNMFDKDLIDKYEGLEFLRPLTAFMKKHDPQTRPTAEESMQFWNSIKKQTPATRWRLRKRDETAGQRVVLNTIDVAKQSFHQITKFFKDEAQ